jgi:hypothetical protein
LFPFFNTPKLIITGVTGYFETKYSSGQAVYKYEIDLSKFVTSCDLSQGLSYHFHTYWTDAKFGASTTTCADTGGHYDPFLACGPSSEDKASLCPLLNRTSTSGYTYGCSPSTYSSGHHSLCEVGDLSGKFGKMMPDDPVKPAMFTGTHIDPMPPLIANYESGDMISKQWASLVIHCPVDNSRILCGHVAKEQC